MSLLLDEEALGILIKDIQASPIFRQISPNRSKPSSLHLKGNPFGTDITISLNGIEATIDSNDFVGIAPGQARLPVGEIKVYIIPPANHSDPKNPLNYELAPH